MATRSRERLDMVARSLHLARQHSDDSDLFRLHLEAFIAFARSVVHVLQSEVKKAGVVACFDPEWKRLGIEPLPEFFRTSRNMLLKEGVKGDSRTRKVVTEIVTSGLQVRDSAAIEVVRASGEREVIPREILFPEEEETLAESDSARGFTEHFFANGPFKDQGVFGVCQQYVERLQKAILEAEKCGASALVVRG